MEGRRKARDLSAASPRTLSFEKWRAVSGRLKSCPDTRPGVKAREKAGTKAKTTAGPSTRPGTPGLAQDDMRFLVLGMTLDERGV